MDAASFSKSASGRLLDIGRGRLECYAFVPWPLPPALSFDLELVNALSEADRAVANLAGLGSRVPNPDLLLMPFLQREAVLSSRIEGTQAGIEDVYTYQARVGSQLPLPGLPEPASDTPEVINYMRAMQYGRDTLRTVPVSLRLIRGIHKVLLEGGRGESKHPGEFRKRQVWIGDEECPIEESRYVPPPVSEMQAALHEWESYLHAGDSYPPLVRLAFIHYQFEAIHPFEDGNGRIGRLLMPLLLLDWGVMPVPLLYLSAALERRRQRYYDLLLAVSQTGEWRSWVIFFLQAIAEQARDVTERVKALEGLRDEWYRKLTEAKASTAVASLADSLFETPILTIPLAQVRAGVAYHTARKYILLLEQLGIVQQLGEQSYNKVYVADSIRKAVMAGARRRGAEVDLQKTSE